MQRGAAPLALGTASVAAGAAFLTTAGALPGTASRNVAAYLLGLALGWVAHRIAHRRYGVQAIFCVITVTLGMVLTVGTELDGVRRWLPLGPVNIQPALFLAPLLLALMGGRESRHWRSAVLLPLALLAMQPDAATSVALAVGIMLVLLDASQHSQRGWSRRRILVAASAAFLCVVGLVVAGIRTPPAVAFVEGTVEIAAMSGAVAVALHLSAIALMLAAPLSRHDATGNALAAYFAICGIAAVFWAFPMPVAGGAPSHLAGFGIAIGWLVERDRRARRIAV